MTGSGFVSGLIQRLQHANLCVLLHREDSQRAGSTITSDSPCSAIIGDIPSLGLLNHAKLDASDLLAA